jgi:hypothetical protein
MPKIAIGYCSRLGSMIATAVAFLELQFSAAGSTRRRRSGGRVQAKVSTLPMFSNAGRWL